MRERPPQILLSNYMTLELLLTRLQDRSIRDAIYQNLKYSFSTSCIRTEADKVLISRFLFAVFAQNAIKRLPVSVPLPPWSAVAQSMTNASKSTSQAIIPTTNRILARPILLNSNLPTATPDASPWMNKPSCAYSHNDFRERIEYEEGMY